MMGKIKGKVSRSILIAFLGAAVFYSCTPKVACPTGHLDAQALSAGASNGKGTEKKRTENGLIKAKKKKKRR